ALPRKAGSQDRMPIDQLLPDSLERLDLKSSLQKIARLTEIDLVSRRIDAVEQQSLLHRREWIKVLRLSLPDHHPIQFRLLPLRKREVRGPVPSRLRTLAMRDQLLQRLLHLSPQPLDPL